jgi:hypothetical protein
MKSSWKNVAEPVLFFLFLLLIWEILVHVVQVPAFILPPPRDLWVALWDKLPILGNHALTFGHDFAVGVHRVQAVHGCDESWTLIGFHAAPRQVCHPCGDARAGVQDVRCFFARKSPQLADVSHGERALPADLPLDMFATRREQFIDHTPAAGNHNRPMASLNQRAGDFNGAALHTAALKRGDKLNDGYRARRRHGGMIREG